MYAHARPTFWSDPTGNAPGDLWDPRSYDWGVFAKEVGKRSVDVTANVLTLGGYGGVKRGLAEGRVTATDGSSGVEAYAQGVFNTITLGGGERAVEGYAEGQGGAGVVVEGITGVAETVLPISETKTILDPTTNGWEKAEAVATGVTKVATLAAGGIAGKSALAGRAAAAEQAAIRTRVLNNIAESQAARRASRFGGYAEAEAAAAREATTALVAPKSGAQRAREIHRAVGEGTQGRTTIAVTETTQGTRVVTSSERRLRPAQRRMLQEGEIEGVGPGHAETTGVNAAEGAGLTPTGTGASRPICPTCATELEQRGIEPLSPLKRERQR